MDKARTQKAENEERIRKSPKKSRYTESEEKKPEELLEMFENHFLNNEDVVQSVINNPTREIIKITHPSFAPLMDATLGFRSGELTILGAFTFKGKTTISGLYQG